MYINEVEHIVGLSKKVFATTKQMACYLQREIVQTTIVFIQKRI